MFRWDLKNGPYVGLKIREKVTLNGTEIPNFPKTLYFFPKFYKNDTLRGTDFSNLLFLRPNLGLVGVKKGTLTGRKFK